MNRVQIIALISLTIAIIFLIGIGLALNWIVSAVLMGFGIIVIVLICSIYPKQFVHIYNQLFFSESEKDGPSLTEKTKEENSQVELKIVNYDNEQFDSIISRIDALEKFQEATNANIQTLYTNTKKIIEYINRMNGQTQQTQKKETGSDTNQLYPRTFYAQAVDSLNPLGFTQHRLTKERDKSIFVITVTSKTKATYALINDSDIQQGLINMINPIITNSSEYDGIPPIVKKIYTIVPGILNLSNDVWIISKKQQVKFE